MRSIRSYRRVVLTVATTLLLLPAALHAQFVYVANTSSGNISGYTINSTTGALTPILGSPFPTATQPSPQSASPLSVAVDPTGKFAYSANFADTVSGYAINSTTGVLAPIPGSPFIVEGSPSFVAVDPKGRFVYVATFFNTLNPNRNILGYTINSTTGALTAILGSPFPTEPRGSPASLAIDLSGKYAYAANNSGTVSGYTINSETGALTVIPGSPFAAGESPTSVAVDPSSKFVYVANQEDNDISGYTINSETGALTAIPGSPFVDREGSPVSIAIDPSGKFIYAASLTAQFTPGRLSGFTINSDTGALTEIFLNPPLLLPAPTFVAVDPSGKFAYVASDAGYPNPGSVWGYMINTTTGVPAAFPGSPFPAGISPRSIAITGCATPPNITDLSASPATLWPPNHQLVDVLVNYDVAAPCGEPAVCTLSVASSEPDDQASPDWVVVDEHHVELRAERLGNGTGRIYTVTVRCKDARGNSATQNTAVIVPHDQGH
jgi:6-phosphogluconolactonase